MISFELNKQYQKLDYLFKKVSDASDSDIEMMSHWAKYLCVLSAGFIENALREVYSDFVKNASSKPVAQFTNSVISKVRNPKTQKFVEVANAFKNEWADELQSFVEENGRKEAIDSIMNNRHLISHGKQSGITINRLKPYFHKSIEVIEFIEHQCKK